MRISWFPCKVIVGFVVLTVLVMGLSPIQAAPAGAASRLELRRRIDTYLTRLVPFGFSGTVLVARDGEVVLSAGYGLADTAASVPNTPTTVFGLQSVTKQFTAAAIMALQMDGKLSVEDELRTFFPDAPPDKRAITLHQLLSHTSGVVSGTTEYFPDSTREGILWAVFDAPLAFEPGTSDRYSNLGYAVLAAVVEVVSGRPFQAFVRERLFDRAGLRATGHRPPDWPGAALATVYSEGEAKDGLAERSYPDWNHIGSGWMGSTVEDLYRWHRALLGDEVLDRRARERMFEPVANDYGYGWIVRQTPRGKLIEHDGGSSRGGAANIRRYVEAGVVTIVLCNRDGEEMLFANRLVDHLDTLVFGDGEVALPPEVRQIDTSSAGEIVGVYRTESGAEVRVAREGNLLIVAGTGQQAIDALFGDRAASGNAEINSKSGAALSALAGGDAGVMESFGGERIAGYLGQARVRSEKDLGPLRGYRVVGTAPDWVVPGGQAMTIAVAEYERGARFFRLHWAAGRLHALGGAAITEPAKLLLLPGQEVDSFGAYHLPTATAGELRLERDDAGAVVFLLVRGTRLKRAAAT